MKKYFILLALVVAGCTSNKPTTTMMYMPCECSTEYAVDNSHTHVDDIIFIQKLKMKMNLRFNVSVDRIYIPIDEGGMYNEEDNNIIADCSNRRFFQVSSQFSSNVSNYNFHFWCHGFWRHCV